MFQALTYIPHIPEISGVALHNMASILGQSETNQQIFDSFVCSILDDCGAQLVDLSKEALIDSVESGQASTDVALNLIVISHATWLFSEICTPIDELAWTNNLTALKPRLASTLPKCRDIVSRSWLDSGQPTDALTPSWNHFWHVVVPLEYGLEPWEEFKGSRLLTSTKVAECPFLGDLRIMAPWPPDSPKRLAFERELVEYSDITTLTSWHYFAVSDRISDLLEKLEPLEFDDWATAVDVCSLLMSRAEPLGEDLEVITEQPWSFTSSEIKASPTSAEHWAWQFGRVTALWSMGQNVSTITPDEYFNTLMSDWANGLTALSLLCSAKGPYEALLEACWDGISLTSHKRVIEDVVGLTPTSHLFWLMRIGFLDGVKKIERYKNDKPIDAQEPKDLDLLLLGTPEKLGKAMYAAQEAAKLDRETQIENNLAERLGKVWNLLPQDARDHLCDAEMNRQVRRRKDASLDYANAVEVALAKWLVRPNQQGNWPKDMGAWIKHIRNMTLHNESRDRLDGVLRKRFDPKYAAPLSEALEVFQQGRLARAHPKHSPPFASEAREKALGNKQNPSVFELLLRFAKRWQS